ncbi:MAG: hypothetical protein QOH33_371, partial [Paraburkholderia sp.]|nr:hypothetical protein [Paraburkholderia sp.]
MGSRVIPMTPTTSGMETPVGSANFTIIHTG